MVQHSHLDAEPPSPSRRGIGSSRCSCRITAGFLPSRTGQKMSRRKSDETNEQLEGSFIQQDAGTPARESSFSNRSPNLLGSRQGEQAGAQIQHDSDSSNTQGYNYKNTPGYDANLPAAIEKGMPRAWSLFPYGVGGVLARGQEVALPQMRRGSKIGGAIGTIAAQHIAAQPERSGSSASSCDGQSSRRMSHYISKSLLDRATKGAKRAGKRAMDATRGSLEMAAAGSAIEEGASAFGHGSVLQGDDTVNALKAKLKEELDNFSTSFREQIDGRSSERRISQGLASCREVQGQAQQGAAQAPGEEQSGRGQELDNHGSCRSVSSSSSVRGGFILDAAP